MRPISSAAGMNSAGSRIFGEHPTDDTSAADTDSDSGEDDK